MYRKRNRSDELKRTAFGALCYALEQNDRTVTHIDDPFPLFQTSNPYNDFRRLADALQGNSRVRHFTLDLGHSFCTLEYGDDDALVEEVVRMAEPFLQYLRNAPPTVQTVELIHRGNYGEKAEYPVGYSRLEQLSKLVLHALAENNFFKYMTIRLPIVSLNALTAFATTTRIQSLDLKLETFGAAGKMEVATVEAVCSIRTLESLKLKVALRARSLNWEATLLQSMLRKLKTHGRLHKLSLIVKAYKSDTDEVQEASVEPFDGLARYLEASLILKTFDFSLEGMLFTKRLLELFLRGVAGSTSLVKLAMSCAFDEDSKICFVQFFQARRKNGVHSIRELHLGYCCCSLFDNSTFGKVMASALATASPNIKDFENFTSSFGASLKLLSFDDVVDDLDEFFQFLSTGVSKLSKLELAGVYHTSWPSHLPALIHLRELNVGNIARFNESKANFIDGLRRNGSLHSLTNGRGGFGHFLDEEELLLVHSFLSRNCRTTALLSSEKVQDTRTDGTTHLSLFPILFRVSRQAERTAPNTVLAALLFVQDYIGPNHDWWRRL